MRGSDLVAAHGSFMTSQLVKENKLFVFMKGTPDMPMCGFSKAVCQVLDLHGVDLESLKTFNVLEDPAVREGVKQFS